MWLYVSSQAKYIIAINAGVITQLPEKLLLQLLLQLLFLICCSCRYFEDSGLDLVPFVMEEKCEEQGNAETERTPHHPREGR